MQGPSFGAGMFRATMARLAGVLVLLGCEGALPQGTQGKLLQLLSNLLLHLGVLDPKMPKIAISGFHTADGELEIMCD